MMMVIVIIYMWLLHNKNIVGTYLQKLPTKIKIREFPDRLFLTGIIAIDNKILGKIALGFFALHYYKA